jgi:hypothetical protein
MSVKFSPVCHNQPNFNVKWYFNVVHVFRKMVHSVKENGREIYRVLGGVYWIPYKRCIQLWHQFTCNPTEGVRILLMYCAVLHSERRVDVTGYGGQRPKDMLSLCYYTIATDFGSALCGDSLFFFRHSIRYAGSPTVSVYQLL